MLETLIVVLILLWALGLVTSVTMGGLIHILLVIAVVVLIVRLLQGRGVGLAVDRRAPVLAFLQHQPVGFDLGLAGLEGIALARSLGNAGGGLPFTIALNKRGGVIERKLGALAPADLSRWAKG